MRLLFLDDDEERHEVTRQRVEATHVRSVAEMAELIKTHTFDVMSLDHDLEDLHYGCYDEQFERTGLDAVKLIIALPLERRPELVIVHSWNPVGARRMCDALRDANVNHVYQPFDYVV